MPLFAAYATLIVALTWNRWKQRLSAAHFIQEYTSHASVGFVEHLLFSPEKHTLTGVLFVRRPSPLGSFAYVGVLYFC